jgi:phosphatidylinositol phospholipase C delta
LDKDIHDEEDLYESDKSQHHNVAPEYKGLIAIHAGKSKGGIEAWFKVDPDKAKRISLSEQQLEKAAITHGKEIVRYCKIFLPSLFYG